MTTRALTVTAHPLFPSQSADEDPPEVEWIHVTRFTGDGQRYAKHRFPAGELTELEDIDNLFGGGSYELIAYASGGITARRRYKLDGRSRPLNPEEPEGDTGASPVVQPPPPSTGDGAMGQFLQLLVSMMQASAQQNAQLISLLLQQSQAQTQTHVQTMAQLYERSQARDAEIFKLLAERSSAGAGGSGVDGFIQGVQLGREISGESEEDTTLDKVAEVVQAITAGAQFAAKGQQQPSTPPGPEVPA